MKMIGGGRRHGVTAMMLEKIESLLTEKALVIVPCMNKAHARWAYEAITSAGLRANIKAQINKGMHRQPFKSRRSIHIEVIR